MKTRICRLTVLWLVFLSSCSSDQFELTIDEQGILLRGATMETSISADAIDLTSINAIDLDSAVAYQPINRLWGVGQPEINYELVSMDEYLEGWFLLRNGDIAFVLLSGHRHAVYFETSIRAPQQVLMLDDLQRGDRPEALKKHSVLTGTDKPLELVQIIESHFSTESN